MSEASTIISDFVLLGRAVPVDIKGARNSICAAGYSAQMGGLVRVYPTRAEMPWRRWSIARVCVRRHPQDSRPESWHLHSDWENSLDDVEVLGLVPVEKRRSLISPLVVGCVRDLNESRTSLGIIKPDRETLATYHEENPHYGQPMQTSLGLTRELDVDVRKHYRWQPRVRFRCKDCRLSGSHKQQVASWEFYQWQRKNPDRLEQVWENARFSDNSYDLYFLVGNQRDRRTSYMVISVLRLRRAASAFDMQASLLS